MIRIFAPSDTDFTSNGDAVINATLAVVHKADNGDFYLELQCGLEYIDYIKPKNIVVVNTPQGAQAFRIDQGLIINTNRFSPPRRIGGEMFMVRK